MITKIRLIGKNELGELGDAIAQSAIASGFHASKKEFGKLYKQVADVKISDKQILDKSRIEEPDFIIIVNDSHEMEEDLKDITDDTIVIVNSNKAPKIKKVKRKNLVTIDAYSMALEKLSRTILWPVMLGAFVKKFDPISMVSVKKAVEKDFIHAIEEAHKTVKK